MREDFKDELFQVVKNMAGGYNFRIPLSLEVQIRNFISNGVDRMTSQEYLSQQKRAEARQNISILAQLTISRLSSETLTESIQLKTFSSIRSSICPLWPFC